MMIHESITSSVGLIIPLSLASPDQFPAVCFHSPAALSSFFHSDLTHLFSHPSLETKTNSRGEIYEYQNIKTESNIRDTNSSNEILFRVLYILQLEFQIRILNKNEN